VNIPKKQ